MNLSWLTWRDLEYLEAVARLRHFGQAAEACHVSQPALSAQIAKMERQLDCKLFERSSRKVSPTAEGEEAARVARDLMERARALLYLAPEAQQPFGGQVRLAAIATLGPYYLPHVVPLLRREYTQAKLWLEEGLTDVLLEQLQRGELDMVLLSDTFDHKGLKVFPLFREPLWLAAPSTHALIHKPILMTRDLDARELLVLRDGHCLKDEALGYCRLGRGQGTGSKTTGHLQAASLETLRQLVALGEGYTLMPFLAVRKGDGLGKLIRYREFSGGKVTRSIVLVCRDNYVHLEAVAHLADLLRSAAPKGLDVAI
jgi:LysR family transcriptional regulator, hydrogen peroxide-inducible genes activator